MNGLFYTCAHAPVILSTLIEEMRLRRRGLCKKFLGYRRGGGSGLMGRKARKSELPVIVSESAYHPFQVAVVDTLRHLLPSDTDKAHHRIGVFWVWPRPFRGQHTTNVISSLCRSARGARRINEPNGIPRDRRVLVVLKFSGKGHLSSFESQSPAFGVGLNSVIYLLFRLELP